LASTRGEPGSGGIAGQQIFFKFSLRGNPLWDNLDLLQRDHRSPLSYGAAHIRLAKIGSGFLPHSAINDVGVRDRGSLSLENLLDIAKWERCL
jgi:hypothetical protein